MVKLIADGSSVDTTSVDTTSVDARSDVLPPDQDKLMTVYLAYAEDAKRQHYVALQVSHDNNLYDALVQSGWLVQFPDLAKWCNEVIDIATPSAKNWRVGIYAQKQPLSYQLQPFDRIEVYRSLSADPMSQRKSKSRV